MIEERTFKLSDELLKEMELVNERRKGMAYALEALATVATKYRAMEDHWWDQAREEAGARTPSWVGSGRGGRRKGPASSAVITRRRAARPSTGRKFWWSGETR